jgi:signal transduction histidine kinase/CheY-like chemotaxis protein
VTAQLSRLPAALVSLDADGLIVASNDRARALLGTDATGARLDSIALELDAPSIRAALANDAATDNLFVHFYTPTRQIVAVDLCLGPAPATAGDVRYAVLGDARPRLENEREYEQRAGTLAFVAELAELFAGELDAQRGFERAIALVREYVPAVGVAIARADRDGRVVALVGARGVAPTALSRLLEARVDESGVVTDKAVARITAALPADSNVMVRPLIAADSPVGVALFTANRPLGSNAIALLKLAARTFSVALRAAKAMDDVRALDAERTQLLDVIPVWVFRLDDSGLKVEFVNGAVARGLGVHDRDRLLGVALLERLAEARDRELFEHARTEAIEHGESQPVELRFRSFDSKIVVIRTRLHRVAAGESAQCVEGIGQDVTDELETRKQLVHTDRLASLGALAAGVAHEINNPAAFILLGTQQLGRLLQQLPSDDASSAIRARMSEVVGDLHDGVQRIAQIVGELRMFARIPESAVSTPVDVNRLMTSAVTLTQAVVKSRAKVVLDLGQLPPLPGDHARLGQVFVNLLVNAAQAIPTGDPERHCVRVETREQSGNVIIRVSDTGVGIPEENLPRVFDPFFTTKGPGDGTGLGLTISMDLVRRAGGTIEVHSEIGRGTTFTITLPVRQSVRSSHPPVSRPSEPPTGGRVLVVEDEQALAIALSRGLSPRFHVEHASDGVRAFERLTREDAPLYDAVLCDLRIPGMDGPALYDATREARPAQASQFVFLTGGAITDEHVQFLRACGRPVLEKPFRMEELDAVLADVITVAGEGR